MLTSSTQAPAIIVYVLNLCSSSTIPGYPSGQSARQSSRLSGKSGSTMLPTFTDHLTTICIPPVLTPLHNDHNGGITSWHFWVVIMGDNLHSNCVSLSMWQTDQITDFYHPITSSSRTRIVLSGELGQHTYTSFPSKDLP